MTAGERCSTCGHVETPGALTTRQREVLRFVESCVAVSGVAPTQATMRAAFGFRSPATVCGHLATLERKGYLRREHGQKQGITLLVHTTERA